MYMLRYLRVGKIKRSQKVRGATEPVRRMRHLVSVAKTRPYGLHWLKLAKTKIHKNTFIRILD